MKGFSLLEVLIALALLTLVSSGLFRLQAYSQTSLHKSNNKLLISSLTSNLFNQIYAQLPISDNNSISRGASFYIENSYLEHLVSNDNCFNKWCDEKDYAGFIISNWKSQLQQLPIENVHAIVCKDVVQNTTAPTLDNPNCSASGTQLVAKVIWQNQKLKAEESILSSTEYLIMDLPKR